LAARERRPKIQDELRGGALQPCGKKGWIMRRSLLAIGVFALGFLLVGMRIMAAERAVKKAAAAPADVEARENIHQALLAETLGDNAERGRRLAKAWISAPDLPEANWHTARVRVDGKWLSLAEVTNQTSSDPNLALYRELREKAQTPKLRKELAHWCKKAGWPDVARLHYAQLLANPAADGEMRQEAIKELDLHQFNGNWVTGEELAARQAQAKAIDGAVSKWRPRLAKLQAAIDGEDSLRRHKALDELNQLDDPAIIPALESLLADGGEEFQMAVVRRLSRFSHYEATVTLVRCAVLSNYSAVRSAATEALKKRPMHEYVPLLLGGLVAPIKSQFQVVWDAKGGISYGHAFLREGLSGNQLLLTQELALPLFSSGSATVNATVRVPLSQPAETKTTRFVISDGKTPYQAFQEQLASTAAQAADKETQVRLANGAIESSNQRLFETLEQTTSQSLKREPVQWATWWQGYNEYRWPRPTACIYQWNTTAYRSQNITIDYMTGTRHTSCFVAGTPVRTRTGQTPIEMIKPGDQVLSQDQDTGELCYKTVLTTTLRPPTKMVTIKAGGEEITTTLGHPFWVCGQGWKMAKQLQPGDMLHGLGGAVKIESVEPLAREPRAYNLVVDDFNTYFVGQSGLLVHDNEFRKPTRAIVPGLVTDDGPQPKK
jgi:Pretoxin HINT domain/HEAT repeats